VADRDGLLVPGNINLYRRPKVLNPDGTISTIRSISFQDDKGHEVLIPTVSDEGRILSDEEAIASYLQTGKHLGIFATPESATKFAIKLHEAYAAGKYDVSGKTRTTINGVPIEPAVSHR
jgi:hypothetical protein